MNIVLHSDDLFMLEYWNKSIQDNCTLVDTLEELLIIENSLIIVNLSACSIKYEDIIKSLVDKNNKVLVLDHEPVLSSAKNVMRCGAKGYGNVLMKSHFLTAAIGAIKDDMLWLYPSLTSKLISEIENSNNQDNSELLTALTDRQKEVAKLIADGLTYKEIASELAITARTVKSHAEKTYKKLGVKDRLGLALLLR